MAKRKIRSGTKRLEEFYVPTGFVIDFAKLLQKYKLNNVIAGVEDDELVVFTDYWNNEQKIINRIHNKIGEYVRTTSRKDLGTTWNGYTGSEAFNVPMGLMPPFVELISKYGLKNSIVGLWQSDHELEIIVVVVYERSQQDIIDWLLRKIEKYKEDQKDTRWKLNGFKIEK